MKPEIMKFRGVLAAAFVLMAAFAFSARCVAAPKGTPPMTDPKKIFDESLKKTAALKDYRHKFEFTDVNPKSNKEQIIVCDLLWMKPDYLKLSVVQGQHAGSVVAYNPAKSIKKVQAKQNGIAIPGGMDKTNPMIAEFFTSDWNSNISVLRREIKDSTLTLLAAEKVKGRDAYKIQSVAKKSEFSKIIIWVDKKDFFLLGYEHYKGGKFFNRKTWYDIKTDTGLKAADFVP